MARKIKTRKTAEDRRAEAQALQESIAGQVEELRSSDQWERFLAFAQSFHNYSINNVLLILGQRPTASRVAGFRQWQAKGRQVRKGEKAIKIFGFRQKKTEPADDTRTTGAEDEGEVITYFPMLSVFDIDQTDPVDPDDDPSNLAHPLTGADELGIAQAATEWLTEQGWTVTREPIGRQVHGYTHPETRRVVIEETLSPAHAAKTTLHEAAHVILHAEEDRAEYVEHRGIKETEAESVAYVVAGILGLDTAAYSIGYVAGWSHCETETIKDTAARVLRAAHSLAEAITEPAEETAAA